MMLIERTSVPSAALPVQDYKDHLRLGRGFADDAAQDALLQSNLRAAIAAVEARIGKALVSREFAWTLTHWRDHGEQALPIAPVREILSVERRDAVGAATPVDPARYRLVEDPHRPRIVAVRGNLPAIMAGGSVEISFIAGFGPEWSDVPVDLAQAVFLLAAQYFEHRAETAGRGVSMPFGVMALIERWRTVRVLGGGAA